MTKAGMPNAPQSWQKTDCNMATVLKSQGYATGQFGKNHQGDRDEHLPTMHGFDEFLGSLYHLNAEEEPDQRDYPRDMKLANGKTFLETFGPRGVLKCKADGKGGQTIENLGPLTKKSEKIRHSTIVASVTSLMAGDQEYLAVGNRHVLLERELFASRLLSVCLSLMMSVCRSPAWCIAASAFSMYRGPRSLLAGAAINHYTAREYHTVQVRLLTKTLLDPLAPFTRRRERRNSLISAVPAAHRSI
jgi:hypothetical protein